MFLLLTLLTAATQSTAQNFSSCCRRIFLESSGEAQTHQPNHLGEYSLTGIYNERPLYRSANSIKQEEEFLFYLRKRSIGLWMVGPEVSNFDEISLRTLWTSLDSPCVENFAVGKWLYKDGKSWKLDQKLTVSCLDIDPNVDSFPQRNLFTTQNLRFENHIESITKNIEEGTKVMKQMSNYIKSTDIITISKINERKLVRDLARKLFDFKSKFDSSKNAFDQMYKNTQKLNIKEEHHLRIVERNLTAVVQKRRKEEKKIEELEKLARDEKVDLREDWEIACFASLLNPIGHSLVDACAYVKAHNELEKTEKIRDELLREITDIQVKLKKQKQLLRELQDLNKKIQSFKTEVDIIQKRAESVEGYPGINLEPFVAHFRNLVTYIFNDDRFIWSYTRVGLENKVARIFSILQSVESDLKIIRQRIKEKNEKSCSNADLCFS